MISILDYTEYKAYLIAVEAERSSFQRGFRSRLAEKLECQNAYVSQVLNNDANFGLEQGIQIAEFLSLNELETKYFLCLLEYARAGTQKLRDHFAKEMESLRDIHLNIKNRLTTSAVLGPEARAIYYSNWIYAAVHVLLTIPKLRTPEKIATSLGASLESVNKVLLFLLSSGLAIEKKGEVLPGQTLLHLTKDSPEIRQHHTNWRVASIQSLSDENAGDIHYSTVSSISEKDAEILKSKLVQVVQDYVSVVTPSKEETLYNFNLDFYTLIKK